MFGAFAAEGRPWLVPFTAQETTPQPRHFTRVSSVRACVCVCVSERAWQCCSLQSAFSGASPRGGGGAPAALQSLVFV